ncbi:MAG: hypothetical protein JW384_02408 [Nitrosomonadaceae bacterium]|nr:hypothetical protein [Nitrosomonadaceae bacterium]
MDHESAEVSCPKCSSKQFTAQKQGFSLKKAAIGALTVGGVAMGFLGSGKINCTCLSCGHEWRPGKK